VNPTTLSLTALAKAYRDKTLGPLEVTQSYLDCIQPGAIYRLVTPERALRQAKHAENLFAKGIDLGPLQGIPIALKDLIDTANDVTAGGSKVLAESPPANDDAPVAARLDAAGAVFLGKTNMTELAFSGLGLNPHFGTPGCALDASRIPGGSSSGSGVAVASGLACAAIGSDTGGSVRIPASFNGIVGLKTTNGLIPKDGCTALSTTLDTIGPMTRTVEDAWQVFLALAAKPYEPLEVPQRKLRFLLATTVVLDNLDAEVAKAFDDVCVLLEHQGHQVIRQAVPEFQQIFDLYAKYGTFASHESLALYEPMLESRLSDIDPRVSQRILQFRGRSSTDYLRLSYERQRIVQAFWETYHGFDAILAPTVAILPPKIESLATDIAYFKANNAVLRNAMLFNFLAGPVVSVPCAKTAEGLSVGLMIATAPYEEKGVLEIAGIVERSEETGVRS
jgi:aspartyl-tRNA(Asn)/glutamyl-tRNA(Gln) amidotransferase subunit A